MSTVPRAVEVGPWGNPEELHPGWYVSGLHLRTGGRYFFSLVFTLKFFLNHCNIAKLPRRW